MNLFKHWKLQPGCYTGVEEVAALGIGAVAAAALPEIAGAVGIGGGEAAAGAGGLALGGGEAAAGGLGEAGGATEGGFNPMDLLKKMPMPGGGKKGGGQKKEAPPMPPNPNLMTHQQYTNNQYVSGRGFRG